MEIAIIGILIIGFIVSEVLRTLRDSKALPYQAKTSLLTQTELNFYRVLRNAIRNEEVLIFPQIPLPALVRTNIKDRRNRFIYFNKISRLRVDFVLCNTRDMQPIVVIELDDATHKKARRMKRDNFVNAVFAAAKIPLVRIPAQRGYNPGELKQKVKDEIKRVEKLRKGDS